MKLAQGIAVEDKDSLVFRRLQQEVAMRPGLVGQQNRTSGAEVHIGISHVFLVAGVK